MKDFTDSFQIYTSLLIIYKSDEFPKIMKAFFKDIDSFVHKYIISRPCCMDWLW